MKQNNLLTMILLVTSLISCSGSDTYRGLWKATDTIGNKYEINFEAKSFSIKDTTGKIQKYEYTQNTFKSENFVETYGIKTSDGRGYLINFPIASDESKGLIFDENGKGMYAICRTKYISYEDIYKLN